MTDPLPRIILAGFAVIVLVLGIKAAYNEHKETFKKSDKVEFRSLKPAEGRALIENPAGKAVLIIYVGAEGPDQKKMILDFDTGRITYKGIKLDDASKALLDKAVVNMPGFRKQIITDFLKNEGIPILEFDGRLRPEFSIGKNGYVYLK